MVSITLPDELARRLAEVARRENRPVETVALEILEQHVPSQDEVEQGPDWGLILGVFDDDITDMSTTVKETLRNYYKDKYGRPD